MLSQSEETKQAVSMPYRTAQQAEEAVCVALGQVGVQGQPAGTPRHSAARAEVRRA